MKRDLRQISSFEPSGICFIAAAIGAAGAIGGSLISASGAKSAANTQAATANQAAQTQLQMYNQTRADLMPFQATGAGALSQLASLYGLPGYGGGTMGFGGAPAPTQVPYGATTSSPFGNALQTLMAGYAGAQGAGGIPGGAAPPPIQTGVGTPGAIGVPNAAAATQALTQFPGYQFGLSQGITALDRSAASRGLLLSGSQLKAAQEFGQQYGMQQAWQPYVSQLGSLATLGENAAAKTGEIGGSAAGGIAGSQLAAGQATAAGQVGQTNAITGLLGQATQSGLWGMANQFGAPSANPAYSPISIANLSTNTGYVSPSDLSTSVPNITL